MLKNTIIHSVLTDKQHKQLNIFQIQNLEISSIIFYCSENIDMMSSPNTSTEHDTLKLVEDDTPLASVVLQMVENASIDDSNKMVVTSRLE